MSEFNDFEHVELIGKTLDAPVKRGSKGYVLERYPGTNAYLVEFVNRNRETVEVATVEASELRSLESLPTGNRFDCGASAVE